MFLIPKILFTKWKVCSSRNMSRDAFPCFFCWKKLCWKTLGFQDKLDLKQTLNLFKTSWHINSYMTHTLLSCVVSCLLFLLTQGSSSSGRTRSFSLLPHLTPSSSPSSQRHQGHSAAPSNIVTITHHKSPAAARRSRSQYPGQLLEVKEVGDDGKAHSKVLFQKNG